MKKIILTIVCLSSLLFASEKPNAVKENLKNFRQYVQFSIERKNINELKKSFFKIGDFDNFGYEHKGKITYTVKSSSTYTNKEDRNFIFTTYTLEALPITKKIDFSNYPSVLDVKSYFQADPFRVIASLKYENRYYILLEKQKYKINSASIKSDDIRNFIGKWVSTYD